MVFWLAMSSFFFSSSTAFVSSKKDDGDDFTRAGVQVALFVIVLCFCSGCRVHPPQDGFSLSDGKVEASRCFFGSTDEKSAEKERKMGDIHGLSSLRAGDDL